MSILMTTAPVLNLSLDETLSSFASVCAQHIGHIKNWTHVLPSLEDAKTAFDALPEGLRTNLIYRASNHGLEGYELMQKIPEALWDRLPELRKWLDMMDISHVVATSVDETLANDAANWTWELRGVNRARGAAEMTGSEYSEAVDSAREAANDVIGEAPFWEFHDIWKHGFLENAQLIGYTSAWVDKPIWHQAMQSLQKLWKNLRAAKTWNDKLSVAYSFAKSVRIGFLDNKNHLISAFLLGTLTLMWPPVQWFLGAWALSGLISMFIPFLRKFLAKGMGFLPTKQILEVLDYTLQGLFIVSNGIRHVLDKIKDGILHIGAYLVDVVFRKVANYISAIKPAVIKIVRAAKNALSGFIGWIGSFFGGRMPSYA